MAEFTIEDSVKKHDKDKDGQISKKEFLGENIHISSILELKGRFFFSSLISRLIQLSINPTLAFSLLVLNR